MDFEQLKQRYYGNRVEIYDEIRSPMSQWASEQDAMRKILGQMERGSSVVDLPVGTGRYAEFYKELGLRPIGADISVEMLEKTGAKSRELNFKFPLVRLDIRSTPFPDQSVDVVVCTRFLNWITSDSALACLTELRRVSKRFVVFSFRSYRAGRDMSIMQRLYQLKYRFFRFRTRARIMVHEPGVVDAALRENGFTLRERHLVETRAHGSVEYAFYVVERQK